MDDQALSANRKPRGRPRVDSVLVGVRIPPDKLAKLDEYMEKRGITSRPVAIRLILDKWFEYEEPKRGGKGSAGIFSGAVIEEYY